MVRVAYRAATPADYNYVKATWAKSARGLVKGRVSDSFPAAVRPVLDAIVPLCRVAVACSEQVPTAILGWAASIEEQLVYVYVSRELRGHGIAKELVARATEE